MSRTKEYEQYLLGCRFCPMCKPASDSLNATYLECHSTRAHAMIIWRAMNDITSYSEKEVELLYQSNLDGVSEAFCVDHYQTTGYMLAAREDIIEAGKAPAPVVELLNRQQSIKIKRSQDTLLFAEGADLAYELAWDEAEKLANKVGAGVIAGFSGYIPYVLGAKAKAIEEARAMAEAIHQTGAKRLIVTGPESYFTFSKMYKELGITLNIRVIMISQMMFSDAAALSVQNRKVFVHDARAAYYFCEDKPDEKVIMPDFFGPEELLGTGEIYELPRKALRAGGAELMFSVWSRAMANAMGNDEGVSLTYPALAKKMAQRRLKMIAQTGAEIVVTDSMATFVYLKTLEEDILCGLDVKYLSELC